MTESALDPDVNGPSQRSAPPRRERLGKGLATAFSILLMGAVAWPVVQNWQDKPKDNFPLSYYPMFAKKRSKEKRETYLLGLDPDGKRHSISYKYAGVGGLNQVRRQIRRTVKRGGAEQLCQKVASNIVRKGKKRLADVVTVQIVSGTYSLDDYFSGDKAPITEEVSASCPVQRGES